MVSDRERPVDLLFDHEHRTSRLADLHEGLVDVVDDGGSKTEREFVDDEKAWRCRKDARQCEDPLLAAREGARDLALPVGEYRERRVGLLERGRHACTGDTLAERE